MTNPDLTPSSSSGTTSADSRPTGSAAVSGGAAGIGVGIVTIVLGIMVLVWPKATLLVIAVLFGLQLIVLGISRLLMSGLAPDRPAWVRPVIIVLGVLSIAAGVICLFRPGTSLAIVALLLAIGWLAEGVALFVQAFAEGRSAGGRVALVATGLVVILAALAVLVFPGQSLLLLTRFGGIALVVIGVAELVMVVAIRRQRDR